MLYVKITSNDNGAHENIRCNLDSLPDGWIAVPSQLESEALDLLPFITLTIEDGVLTSISDNAETRAAWEAENQPPPPTMTTEEAMLDLLTELDYRTSLLELGITGGM